MVVDPVIKIFMNISFCEVLGDTRFGSNKNMVVQTWQVRFSLTFPSFQRKISKIPWHLYVAMSEFWCAQWVFCCKKTLFPIINVCENYFGLFQYNFLTFPGFSGFPWHKSYSLPLPGFPDFGQLWQNTEKISENLKLEVSPLLEIMFL